MYSRIPVGSPEWSEENLRYALCFFPVVGVVIGLIYGLWAYLARRFGFSPLFFGVIASLIPLAVSGGIHMDGFMDTADALASHQSRERKLEILKDPHLGAFGAMAAFACMLIYAGAMAEIQSWRSVLLVALGFPMSRALSAWMLISLPSARPGGSLDAFRSASARGAVKGAALGFCALCAALAVLAAPPLAIGLFIAGALAVLCYRHMAIGQFGGVTGDLAGWFVVVFELLAAVGLLVAQRLIS